MTLCLGSVFFAIYLLIAIGSFYLLRPLGTDLFFLAYENPIEWIYLGLFLFALFSMGIYFVRMIIIYIFMTRGKDS